MLKCKEVLSAQLFMFSESVDGTVKQNKTTVVKNVKLVNCNLVDAKNTFTCSSPQNKHSVIIWMMDVATHNKQLF